MDRRLVIVIVAVVVVAALALLVRDPVAAADGVRGAWSMLTGAITTVAHSLTTFFQHLAG